MSIARVLELLAESQLVHRDIKPENILITTKLDGTIRPVLIDFGLVARLSDLARTNAVGTAGFIAPEVAAGGPWSSAADVFALGVALQRASRLETITERLEALLRSMTGPLMDRPAAGELVKSFASHARPRPGLPATGRDCTNHLTPPPPRPRLGKDGSAVDPSPARSTLSRPKQHLEAATRAEREGWILVRDQDR